MPVLSIRDVSLFVKTVGSGYPLVLMHGGPGTDHWTMLPFRKLADDFKLVFYDHRCNGRSTGPVESLTWENLTADADVLREELGFEKWAVLGHSFGGHVAIEYALRYPERVSHLILLDTGGDAHWARENAPGVLTQRGFSPERVELVRRWFNGEFEPREMFSIFTKIGNAYSYDPSLWPIVQTLLRGGWQTKFRGETFVFASRHLMPDWTVIDRLGEIAAPTLIVAGREDFVFPPDCQEELASRIPNSQLRIIDHAGHNPHMEQPAETVAAIRAFVRSTAAALSLERAASPATTA